MKSKFGELASITSYTSNGSFAGLRENVTYYDSPNFAILVRLVDRNNDWNASFVYVDEHSYNYLKKSSLDPDDLILSNIGVNLGTVFRVPDLKQPMTLGPNSFVLKADKKLQDFLYYYLISPIGKHKIQSIVSGSAQPKFNTTDLKNLEIELPIEETRIQITQILKSLDTKISNLQNQNRVLEQTAQAIFQSWFVDFDGVTEWDDSELGKIPKRWQVGKFSDVIAELESGKRPKGGINSSDMEIPSIGAENIIGLGQYNYSKTKYISLEFFNEMKTGKIEHNDVLLYKDGASLGRKSLFRDGFPFKQCCINEHVFILRPNKKISSSFLFFWLDQDFMEENVKNLN